MRGLSWVFSGKAPYSFLMTVSSGRWRRRALFLLLALGLVLTLALALLYLRASAGGLEAGSCRVLGQDGSEAVLSADQAQNAATVAALTLERDMNPQAALIALATVSVETDYVNLPYGDRDSVGLFQQRPSQGWGSVEQIMDPVYSAHAFYNNVDAVKGYEALPVGDVAQRIQLSGYPDRYAQHEQGARPWAQALTGVAPASVTCVLFQDQTAVERPHSLEESLAREFGDSIRIEKQEGQLLVTPGGNYSGDGSLEGQEADAAVLAALANWAVIDAGNSGSSIRSVAHAGKIWTADENTRRTLLAPAGWQDSTAASDSVLITLK